MRTSLDLQATANAIEKEIGELKARIVTLKQELDELWKDDMKESYELTSVFIHRGTSAFALVSWARTHENSGDSPTFGHYFFYARHLPDKPDEWFKYNDEEVKVVSKDEVLRDTTRETANPYLVCLPHLTYKGCLLKLFS